MQQQQSKWRIVVVIGLWSALMIAVGWSFLRTGTWSGTGGPEEKKEKETEAAAVRPGHVEDVTAQSLVAVQAAVAASRRESLIGSVKEAERKLDGLEDERRRWKEVETLLTSEDGKALSEEPLLGQFRTLYDRQAERPDLHRAKTLRRTLDAVAGPVRRAHEKGQNAYSPSKEAETAVADALAKATLMEQAQREAREEVLRLAAGRKAPAGAKTLGEAIEQQKREKAAREAAKLADDRRKEEERAEAARQKLALEQLRQENEQKLELEKAKEEQRAKAREKELEEVRRQTEAKVAAAEELAAKKAKLAKAKAAARDWLSDVPAEDTVYMRNLMSNATGFFYNHPISH